MSGAPPPRLVEDPQELVEFYSDAPAAHIYALVDLDEPFWSLSSWFRSSDAVVGLVTLPGTGFTTAYCVTTRDPQGCLDLLEQLDSQLHAGMQITGPVGLVERVTGYRRIAWGGPHHRYRLTDPAQLPEPDLRVIPLDEPDLEALTSLYATDPDAVFFRGSMLGDRSFVGVHEDGHLVAAAGTHVLSESRGLAAIGAVYTVPSHRGQGLGRAVTAGVCRRIADRIDTIGLNVADDNAPAKALYASMGFESVLAYEEVELL